MVRSGLDDRLLDALVDAVIRAASTTPEILESARMDLYDLAFGENGVRNFAIGVSTGGIAYQKLVERDANALSATAHLTENFPELANTVLSVAALVAFGSQSDPRHPGSVRTLILRVDDDFQVPNHELEYTLTYSVESGSLKFNDLIEYDWPASEEEPKRRLVKTMDADYA